MRGAGALTLLSLGAFVTVMVRREKAKRASRAGSGGA
jgi:hypothetical protein